MNLSELYGQVNKITGAQHASTEQAQLKLRDFQNRYNEETRKLTPLFTPLHKALAVVGLTPSDISFRKSGAHSDTWGPDDTLLVVLTATPTEFRPYRFISHQGYDSQGRGRNQKQLDAKATKLEEHLQAAMPGTRVAVNQFSIEAKRKEGQQNRVMIEFHVG